ncbi:MAG TPA: CGNR zinc finger domain-containing protein [Ktedonobacteraceae bacterium]|nr:CGNR zinc finger domain-containing protein [Ktedonobacteraceae bacterium]
MKEKQTKSAPEALRIVQDFVNTRYGRERRFDLTSPERLRVWLVQHGLLADGAPVTEGDLRRALDVREGLRGLMGVNNGMPMPDERLAGLNAIAKHSPLIVRFSGDGQAQLEPDIAGVDGALARLMGIVYTAMHEGTWNRLKVCRNEPCMKAFYDTSKNHSGTWCSMNKCGNRINARAYRHRHDQIAQSSSGEV